jgi:hypothetical protein
MLTMNIRVDIPRSVMPTFWLKITYPLIVFGKLLMFQNTINRFTKLVKDTLAYYRKQPIENYSINECQLAYQYLTKNLLSKVHIPVENDFLMMTYLGILKKKYSEEKLKEFIAFENISSKQVNQLAEMSKLFYSIPELAEAIDFCDIERFRWYLTNHPKIKHSFQLYFETTEAALANELKLESTDIERDYHAFLLW